MRRDPRPVIFHINTCRQTITHAVQRQLERGAGTQNNFAPLRAQRLQRVTHNVQQHLFNLVRIVRQLRQAWVVITHQRDVIRQLHRDEFHHPLRDLVNAF